MSPAAAGVGTSAGLRQGRQASKSREGGLSKSYVNPNGALNLKKYDDDIDAGLDKAGVDLEGRKPSFNPANIGGTSPENRTSRKQAALEKENKRHQDHRSALALTTDLIPNDKLRGKAKSGMTKAGKAFRQGTSRALTQSWINIIDSFGTTLIYIHVHVFMRLVVGTDFFCKLGHEWYDVYAAKAETVLNASDNAVNRFARRNLDRLKEMTGILEVMVLLLIDLAIIFLSILVIINIAIAILIITIPVWGPIYLGIEAIDLVI